MDGLDFEIQQSLLTKKLIKYEFNFIECVCWSPLLLFIYECVRLTLPAVDVIVSPFTRPSTTVKFVNVLLLIIVFHAFHNKQKKRDDCCSFIYVYFSHLGLFFFFYLKLWSMQLKKFRLELDLRQKSMWCNNCTLCKKFNKFHLSCCFVSYVIYLYYKQKPFLNKRLNLAVKLPVFGPT